MTIPFKGFSVDAVMVNKTTPDGVIGLVDNTMLSRVFTVYPGLIVKFTFVHPFTGDQFQKVFIWADGFGEYREGWVPVDCLEWVGKEVHLKKALEIIH